MKTKYIIPLIPLLLSSAASFAAFPDPDPLRTLNARYDFKQFMMAENYTYAADTWAALSLLDRTVFQYSDGNVAADGTISTGGPASAQGLELTGNYTFAIDSGNSLSFAWINTGNNAKINLDNGVLNIAGSPPSGAAENWFNSGSLTLTNGAAFNANDGAATIRHWNHTITASDSAIKGGINAWHSGAFNLTGSTWDVAAGTTLFQYHGNGNYSMVLDNSSGTLAANNPEGTSYSGGFQLYAHSATASAPLSIELKNGSSITAGTFNADGYTLAGGAQNWMGWTAIDNAKITIDVNTGSTLVLGEMIMGREAANTQANADYKISVSGASDAERSTLAFTNMYMSLTNSAGATETSYKTTIDAGDYSDVYMNSLNLANTNADAKTNTFVNGTAAVNIGSNTNFFVRGGNTNIGTVARLGGTAIINLEGESSVYRTQHLYMGSQGSSGGANKFHMKNSTTDSSTRNELYTFRIELQNASAAGSTQLNEVVIDGNTYIAGELSADTSFRFNIGANESASGTSTVALKGKNIEFGYLYQVNIGNANSSGGTSKLSLQTSDIYRNGDRVMSIAGYLNVLGGVGATSILEFVADDNGFATVSAQGIVFDGILALDFTNVRSDLTQDLIIHTNAGSSSFEGWEDFCESLVSGDTSHIMISKNNDQDTLEFTYSNGTLGIIYTVIPEPGACAAVMGALALCLAACRRKRA